MPKRLSNSPTLLSVSPTLFISSQFPEVKTIESLLNRLERRNRCVTSIGFYWQTKCVETSNYILLTANYDQSFFLLSFLADFLESFFLLSFFFGSSSPSPSPCLFLKGCLAFAAIFADIVLEISRISISWLLIGNLEGAPLAKMEIK